MRKRTEHKDSPKQPKPGRRRARTPKSDQLGNAAIGAVVGGVVAGPVGAVAGAVVGAGIEKGPTGQKDRDTPGRENSSGRI